MNIEDVLLEMRDWKWGLSPRVRAWADSIEAAMRERDAKIERLREPATGVQYPDESLNHRSE